MEQTDQDDEIQAKFEARQILSAFIKTENEAEVIKAKVNRQKPILCFKQGTNPSSKIDASDSTNQGDQFQRDMDLALELIQQRKKIQKNINTNDVALNMELRHAKLQQARQSNRYSGDAPSQAQQMPGKFSPQKSSDARPSQGSGNKNPSSQSVSTSFNHKQAVQHLKNKRINAEQQSQAAGKQLQQISRDLQQIYLQQVKNEQHEQVAQENLNSIISTINQQQEESRTKYNQFRANKVVNTIKIISLRIYRETLKSIQNFQMQAEKETELEDFKYTSALKILGFKKLKRLFQSWLIAVTNDKDERQMKQRLSDEKLEQEKISYFRYYYQRQLLKRHLAYWKQFLILQKSKKESYTNNTILKSKITDFIQNLKQNMQNQQIQQSEKFIQDQYEQLVQQQQIKTSSEENKQAVMQKFNRQKEKIMQEQQHQIHKIHTRLDKLKQQNQEYIQEEKQKQALLEAQKAQIQPREQESLDLDEANEPAHPEQPLTGTEQALGSNNLSANKDSLAQESDPATQALQGETEEVCQPDQEQAPPQSLQQDETAQVSSKAAKNKKQEKQDKLKEIEMRAQKRKETQLQIKQKQEQLKKQKEEEKKQQELQEKLLQKKRKQEEYEQLQQKRKEEVERKQKAEWEKQQTVLKNQLALSHRKLLLMKYYGWLPWAKLMSGSEQMSLAAKEHYRKHIQKFSLALWVQGIHVIKMEEQLQLTMMEQRADQFRSKSLKRMGLQLIRGFYLESKEQHKQLIKQREDYLQRVIFLRWFEVVPVLRQENIENENKYNEIIFQFQKIILQKQYLKLWKQYAEEEKIEKKKNQQKEQMWNKVQGWLQEFDSSKQEKPSSSQQ